MSLASARLTPTPLHHSIPTQFSRVVQTSPQRVAIRSENRSYSYAELDAWSEAIATFLRARGIVPGDFVGLYVQRSPEAVAAMIGILKCGAAYIPFDSAYPATLLEFVYQDSRPKLMLTQEALQSGDLAALWKGNGFTVENASAGWVAPETGPRSPHVTAPIDAEAAAYVMYTSGSTGRPKGVVIPHRGVIRLVLDNPFAVLNEREVILHLAPIAFDASTFEIWGALLNGGTLAIPLAQKTSLDDIAAAIERFNATTLWLTAGLFHLMVDHRIQGLKPLRQLLAGGDVLSPQRVETALRELPSCRLINGYGPTENTTFTCCYTIPRDVPISGSIPIGTAIGHTETFVFDEQRRPVADGEIGELYTGGLGLALGYLNRPELTQEKFVAHPQHPQMRLYRTGDRVRRRLDGVLEFLGRMDRQVKINGKRVELDEIEACLRCNPAVADAAVIVAAVGAAGPQQIFAFVTAAPPQTVHESQLRAWMKCQLPDYMLPGTITVVNEFALTPMGKIDRAKLAPSIPTAASSATDPHAPRNAIEGELLAIWRSVLGRERVGVEENFFDLGGTSLQLLTVLATIQDAMKTDLNIVDLFEHPRISALAARITHGARANTAVMSVSDRAQKQRAALAARGRIRPGSAS